MSITDVISSIESIIEFVNNYSDKDTKSKIEEELKLLADEIVTSVNTRIKELEGSDEE